MVTAASVQDRDSARPLLWRLAAGFRAATLVSADAGYAGKLVTWAASRVHQNLQIVERPNNCAPSNLPRRWVVERTFLVRTPPVRPRLRTTPRRTTRPTCLVDDPGHGRRIARPQSSASQALALALPLAACVPVITITSPLRDWKPGASAPGRRGGSRSGQLRADAMRSTASASTASLVPKFSRTKPPPGVPNPGPGFERDAPAVEEHIARLLAISDTHGSPATRGRSPAAAASEHRVAAR